MKNVITLGKLIGLLFCSLPPLYFVFENSKNTRNEFAANGNHFFSNNNYHNHLLQTGFLGGQGRTIKVQVKAAVVKTVTNDLPAQEIAPVDQLPHLSGLGLADPSFHIPGRIDILLGADVYPQLILKEPMATGGIHDPAAQQTIFGWAIVGPVRYLGNSKELIPTYFAQCQPSENDLLDEHLTRFWQMEEPETPTSTLSSVEEQVQSHYTSTTTYSVSPCRYQVTLPRRDDVPPLGESRSQALCRYIANERAILRRNIYKPFQDVVQSYLDLGHAKLVPASDLAARETYYLPMHSVTKQSSTSTKLRVVFDGSAATTSGYSLNQSLHVGPSLHPTLATILLKFRTYPVAITADIAKMYREVELSPQDKDLHRFIWRATPGEPVKDYRMTRVTFGVSASPYLAIRTLQQTAADHGAEHPIASSHIYQSFYVDDLLAGANTAEEALELFHSLRTVLHKGGFNFVSGGAVLCLCSRVYQRNCRRRYLSRRSPATFTLLIPRL